MNALILAAGLGTRLRPLTDSMPKALVPVGGQTLLERLILRLRADGFDHIVVNVHHFAQQIIDFLRAHDHFGMDIRVSDESACLLDTGGAVKQAVPLFPNDEPVLIHNVDILHNVPLRTFYLAHRDEADSTLLVSQRQTARYLVFDSASRRLRGWTNVKTGEVKGSITPDDLHADAALQLRAFAGIHLFSPRLLSLMRQSWPDCFSIIDFYLQACTSHSICGTEVEGMRLLDVGKLDSLSEAEAWVAQEDLARRQGVGL